MRNPGTPPVSFGMEAAQHVVDLMMGISERLAAADFKITGPDNIPIPVEEAITKLRRIVLDALADADAPEIL
jgi:hypothetical protein